METLRRLSLAYRHRLMVLAVLALAVRALVPAGWMTMPSADGWPRLTICTGTGPIAVTRADHMMRGMPGMKHQGDDAPSHPEHPCAFTGGVLAAELPVLATPPLPPRAGAAIVRAASRDLGLGRGLAAPPPPQTGPPAFA